MKFPRIRIRVRSRYAGRHRRPRTFRPSRKTIVAASAVTAAAVLAVAACAIASPAEAAGISGGRVVAANPHILAAPESIEAVVNNIRTWLIGILAAVATFFLTLGGLRYVASNGDPGEVEKAKSALKSAAIGYALALLAPLFVTIVGQWVK